MSKTQFIESTSADPVERGIAQRVTQILNDNSIDRSRREALVRRAQRELLEHRRRRTEQEHLRNCVPDVHLPAGYRAHAVQIEEGRVQIAAFKDKSSYVWVDAGEVPEATKPRLSVSLRSDPDSGR